MRTFGTSVLFSAPLSSAKRKGFATGESGSLTIFSLFLFVLVLMIAGMAVDIMRYETERVTLQNTVDTAIIAAASLSQEADTDAEIEALVKEYVSKAGYDPDMITVASNIETAGTTQMGRTVSANIDYQVDTMFMNMMGIDFLEGQTRGGAREGQQMIEIALVLDVSTSMSWNSKMDNLKAAAKEFVSTVIANSGVERVSISIVPYNHQVHLDGELMARLNWAEATKIVPGTSGANVLPGALTEYQTRNSAAHCARFRPNDYQTRRLAASVTVEGAGNFADVMAGGSFGSTYSQPNANAFWCGSYFPTVFLYRNDETELHDFIDGLVPQGYTAIDYGMNWGVGVLDPTFEPIVTHMVDSGLLDERMRGHPVKYDNIEVMKYVVLMTDGANTRQADLKDAYKDGPTRIWHSETLANGTEFNGYLVEMPKNPASSRWYVPRSPTTTSDDYYLAASALPADAVQWDHHKLFGRFRVADAAEYFFKVDSAARNAYKAAVDESAGYQTADANLKAICDAAKANNDIEIFTVAFEAPAEGQVVLQDCASKPGNYFDVEGTQISSAFDSIATQISQLRLTE